MACSSFTTCRAACLNGSGKGANGTVKSQQILSGLLVIDFTRHAFLRNPTPTGRASKEDNVRHKLNAVRRYPQQH